MIANKATIEGIDFHFGLGFLADLCEGTEMDLIGLGNAMTTNQLLIVPKMMLHSANYAKKRKGLTDFYSLDFIYDKVDDYGGATGVLWVGFLNAFNESMTKHVPTQEVAADKKKAKKLIS